MGAAINQLLAEIADFTGTFFAGKNKVFLHPKRKKQVP